MLSTAELRAFHARLGQASLFEQRRLVHEASLSEEDLLALDGLALDHRLELGHAERSQGGLTICDNEDCGGPGRRDAQVDLWLHPLAAYSLKLVRRAVD